MKIAHLSDIHFSDKYLQEVNNCTRHATSQLVGENTPDLIALTGDLFDHRLEQNSPALIASVKWVCELGNIAPVIILQGTFSHDVPRAINIFKHVHTNYPVYVADRIQQVLFTNGAFIPSNTWKTETVNTGDDLMISCLPAVNKGVVAATVGAENAAQAVGDRIAELLSAWAPCHRAARLAGVPSILLSHGTVSESETEHGVPMAGLDHEYTTGSIFAADATATMLGHIHKHQSWGREGHMIAYPGSIGRLHFGEYDPKGFLLWHIEADVAGFEFIQTPARPLLDLQFEGAPDMDKLQEAAADLVEGCHVRVRYQIDEEHTASVDKDHIENLFSKAEQLKIEARIAPVQRQRAAGIGQAPSLADKVTRWCEITNTQPEPLLERLQEIQVIAPTGILEQL